jgi:alkanesulfonate monooxygenase SsuD/methylene tetrahydromethanopterin reductase-like flavin-dependent oxidoreductase (luciferase family)/hemerythrin-like domain-containing protein
VPDYGHDLLFGSFISPRAAAADEVVALTELSEEAGLDLATFQDHPYQPAYLDAWTLLSHVAARTESIRLCANVLNAPLRPTAVLARAAASLDLLSHGRLELGIGAGAYWDEIAAMGGPRLAPGEAVPALEESIDVLRQMWAADEPGMVRGRGHQAGVRGAKRGPAPAHDIAIWVGGLKPRMLALIGRVADGWLPSYSYLENRDVLGQGNERIDEAARAAGREPGEVRRLTNVMPADADPQTLAGLTRDFGVSAFILMSDNRAEISRFAAVIAPQVRDLVAADRARDQAGPQQAGPSGAMQAREEPAIPRPAASQPTGAQAGEIRPPAPTLAPLRQLSSRRVWDEEKRPTLPARAADETYTALGRRISDHFVGVHDYLRAELEGLRTVAAQVLSGDLDPGRARSALNQMTMRQNEWTLNAYCAKYCGELTQHHSIEDTSIMPHLRRSDPALSPVLDRLAEEHGAIHDLINQVDQAMVAFVKEPARGGPLLHDAIDLLTDSLLSHLSYEERELLAPVTRYGLAPGQL